MSFTITEAFVQQFGDNIRHRTGHNIGREVHGAGANMDNYETHDDRRIRANQTALVTNLIKAPHLRQRADVRSEPKGV